MIYSVQMCTACCNRFYVRALARLATTASCHGLPPTPALHTLLFGGYLVHIPRRMKLNPQFYLKLELKCVDS
jgi:hypothetical protein